VGRPPRNAPGWTVWHEPSGLQAIPALRYREDAETARIELLLLSEVNWTIITPARQRGSRSWIAYERVFRKYQALRQEQLGRGFYWTSTSTGGKLCARNAAGRGISTGTP
jgi:hypothetical protein